MKITEVSKKYKNGDVVTIKVEEGTTKTEIKEALVWAHKQQDKRYKRRFRETSFDDILDSFNEYLDSNRDWD